MSSYLGSKKIKQIFLTDSQRKMKRVLKLTLGDKIGFSDWLLSYDDSSSNYTIIGHSNPVGDLVIPSYEVTDGVNGYHSITRIGVNAFNGCSSLKSITIPDSVISIGNQAFRNCTNLTSVTIGSSVTNIGTYAFYKCTSLTSITIPNSVTIIGNSAFRDCSSLESVTIPSSVTSIGSSAFYGCSKLTSVNIPASVTSIYDFTFRECSNLTTVTFEENSHLTTIYSYAFYKCTSLTSITIPNGVTSISSSAFRDCTNLTSITIPNSVTSIGGSVFSGCSSLESVTLPFVGGSASATSASSSTLFGYIFGTTSYTGGIFTQQYYASSSYNIYYIPSSLKSVTITGGNILYGAFSGCSNLTSVTIPNSVTSIGEDAFSGCSNLTSITIPNSVTSIGEEAFINCSSLKSVTIGNSVTSIGRSAFYSCSNLTSVTIGNSVTSIGSHAFYNCSSLESVTIPNSVTSIGDWAFHSCDNLRSVTIPNSVTSIGDYAFRDCPIEYANIPTMAISYIRKDQLKEVVINSGDSIGSDAFEDCSSLESVTIGNSVWSIGGEAFNNCSNLTSITIPSSVTSIGDSAFSGCSKLTSVYYGWTIDRWARIGFGNYSSNPLSNGADLYINNEKVTEVNLTTTTYISGYAFYNYDNLTSVTIGNSVTSIRDYAFANCSNLTSVTIGNSVKSIGRFAFAYCLSLESVTISNSVLSIGNSAFESAFADNIDGIALRKSITSIGSDAFKNSYGCLYLEYGSSQSSTDLIEKYTNRPVFTNCYFSDESGSVKLTYFTKKGSSIIGDLSLADTENQSTYYPPGYSDEFTGWLLDNSGTAITMSKIQDEDDGDYYPYYNNSGCVSPDSLITLKDLSKKKICDLKETDELLTWNFDEGKFDSASILFIDKEDKKLNDVYYLTFSDNKLTKVIYEHGFFDKTLNKFVYLRDDANEYIGHEFLKYKQDKNNKLTYEVVTLDKVEIKKELIDAWSAITCKDLGYFINDMLTIPGGISGLFNIFDVDSNTLKYTDNKNDDLKKYGIFTYEEFNTQYPISKEAFEALNGEYLKVALGKNLITEDFIKYLYNRYLPLFSKADEKNELN